MASEWKENFGQSQPTPSLFGGILFLVVEAANSFLTNSSWMFQELLPRVNADESVYSKIGESGNIYESGKISSSVNQVLNHVEILTVFLAMFLPSRSAAYNTFWPLLFLKAWFLFFLLHSLGNRCTLSGAYTAVWSSPTNGHTLRHVSFLLFVENFIV